MKNYPKMLCFFLFDLEQHRIVSEVDNREAIRKKKEDDASKLEKKAKDNGEYL